MNLFNYLLKASLLSLIITSTLISHAIARENIDVLFLYSPQVSEHYSGEATTRINHIIESTNAIYASSNLDIQVSAAEIQQYNIDDSIDPYTLMRNAKNSQEIKNLRKQYGADLVVLYGLYQRGKPCGLGYRPTSLNGQWIGISYVAINCAAYKTAHELGHNMGLGHSYVQGSVPFLKYARGHGVKNKFATIMAYSSAYNAPKVYKFSSPNYKCKNITCGVKEGAKQEADAVKALRQTAPIVANLQETKAPEQCNPQQAETFSAIKSRYEAQQSKLAQLSQQLTALKHEEQTSDENYQKILASYRKMMSDKFYPAQKKYHAARDLFVQELSDYRKGKISRKQIIDTYLKYRDARVQIIALYNEVKQYYLSQYRPAYDKLKTAKQQLAALQKTYKTEQTTLAQLQVDYDEANAIYTCA